MYDLAQSIAVDTALQARQLAQKLLRKLFPLQSEEILSVLDEETFVLRSVELPSFWLRAVSALT